MKADDKVTQLELEKEGWENTNERFGDYQIWKNGSQRILWFKKNNVVVTTYSVSNGNTG